MNQFTHQGLARLVDKYGGLFHLRMGILYIIVVSSPDMARKVLQAQDIIFSNCPANMAIAYLTCDRGDMAFANYGPLWRRMRKFFVTKLFSRNRVMSWASVREEGEKSIQTISNKTGTPVNLG